VKLPLTEKYRPSTLDQVIGQEKAVATLRKLRGGFAGRAFWVSGPSGTGKTTLARIIAGSVAEPPMTVELAARDLTAERMREIVDTLGLYGWGKGGRAVIVNESHGLGRMMIERLLDALESIPAHAVWIFTTTKDGEEGLFEDQQDAGPLLSRCVKIKTTNQGFAEAFAVRAHEIAEAEGLNGVPMGEYVKLARKCKNNARAMLMAIDSGEFVAN
jgi:replication-associated recombination protein RarA